MRRYAITLTRTVAQQARLGGETPWRERETHIAIDAIEWLGGE